MMRMLGLALLGSILWASSICVVHALIEIDPLEFVKDPGILLYACKQDNGKCAYHVIIKKNRRVTNYDIPPTDCNSLQTNGYTFTRALDDKSFHAQAPCSGMSIDTLKKHTWLTREHVASG
ncbi:hypothetical protein BCR42DRAFT_393262 [Absidia repens]|uniref:Secreted protein n=1 Tax=Absidia repens TaxID=90262 RepID=A0A1X2IF88_9FUNG|nr:hypothetical protein BCR42DRAFT_393262 [Absidia repens]